MAQKPWAQTNTEHEDPFSVFKTPDIAFIEIVQVLMHYALVRLAGLL
jgi:hypothetical protein